MADDKRVLVFETGENYSSSKWTKRRFKELPDKFRKTATAKKLFELAGEDVSWCYMPHRGLYLNEAVIGINYFLVVELNLKTDLILTFKNQSLERLKQGDNL